MYEESRLILTLAGAAGCPTLTKAIATQHGAVASRLERHLCGATALVARYRIHLPWTGPTLVVLRPARPPAIRAALWLISVTFISVELLIVYRKYKLCTTFDARKTLILEDHW